MEIKMLEWPEVNKILRYLINSEKLQGFYVAPVCIGTDQIQSYISNAILGNRISVMSVDIGINFEKPFPSMKADKFLIPLLNNMHFVLLYGHDNVIEYIDTKGSFNTEEKITFLSDTFNKIEYFFENNKTTDQSVRLSQFLNEFPNCNYKDLAIAQDDLDQRRGQIFIDRVSRNETYNAVENIVNLHFKNYTLKINSPCAQIDGSSCGQLLIQNILQIANNKSILKNPLNTQKLDELNEGLLKILAMQPEEMPHELPEDSITSYLCSFFCCFSSDPETGTNEHSPLLQ